MARAARDTSLQSATERMQNLQLSSSKTTVWRPSLDFILEDPDLRKALVDFASYNQGESVSFMICIKELKGLKGNKAPAIDDHLCKIHHTFIKEYSEKMINLSSYQRNCATAKFYKFVQAVQEQRADEWTVEKKKAMFDECESDIGKLLNPTLASFYKSDLFKKVVAKNGKKYRKKMKKNPSNGPKGGVAVPELTLNDRDSEEFKELQAIWEEEGGDVHGYESPSPYPSPCPSHIISGNVINASKPQVAMDNNGDNEEKVDSGVPSQSGQAHQSGRKPGNRLRKSMRSFAPVDATTLNSSNAASDSSGYRVRTDRVANRNGQ